MTIFKRVNLHQVVIEHHLENFLEYIQKMEEFLDEEVDSFNEKFENDTKDWSEEEKNEYGEYLSDEYWTLAETYPSILRSSMYISIYSFFEKELKDLNQFYQSRMNKISISYPSNKISKTAKALISLEHCFKINFSQEIEEWKKIDGIYREIRNIIVHDGGEVEIDKINKYTTLCEELPIDIKESTGELQLHKELCLSFLRDIASFFNEFFDTIKENKKNIY